MNGQGGRFRKKKVNFSMVSNSIIRDPDISLKAKGLYALIQSYITIDDFVLYKGFLQSRCREGKKAFESAWSELKRSGYLVQYRMQDLTTKRFYWEYELLDEVKPDPQKGDMAENKPIPQKGYDGKGSKRKTDNIGKGADISNTDLINTYGNNTNQIISAADVMEQIEYHTFPISDLKQIDEILLLMLEVLNSSNPSIRIAREDKPISEVKERFRRINKFHVEYVLDCLRQTTTKISNMKNYLLTALYNAPTTFNSYYQNKVNHDFFGKDDI